jgi:hypothetical protein
MKFGNGKAVRFAIVKEGSDETLAPKLARLPVLARDLVMPIIPTVTAPAQGAFTVVKQVV